MSVYKYQIIKKGIVTNEWTSSAMGIDYYEPSFGLPERLKMGEECTPEEIASAIEVIDVLQLDGTTKQQYKLPKTYQVIIADITPEIDAETQKKDQIKSLKQRVKTLANQADLTTAEVKECIFKLVKAMLLNKDLD